MNLRRILLLFLAVSAAAYGQPIETRPANSEEPFYRYFVGSTLLMLGNFIPDDPNRPDFAQVNLGYRITPKNVVFLELKTSKFNWPLGMPWPELVDEQRQNLLPQKKQSGQNTLDSNPDSILALILTFEIPIKSCYI